MIDMDSARFDFHLATLFFLLQETKLICLVSDLTVFLAREQTGGA
jgi:hypothetical protein